MKQWKSTIELKHSLFERKGQINLKAFVDICHRVEVSGLFSGILRLSLIVGMVATLLCDYEYKHLLFLTFVLCALANGKLVLTIVALILCIISFIIIPAQQYPLIAVILYYSPTVLALGAVWADSCKECVKVDPWRLFDLDMGATVEGTTIKLMCTAHGQLFNRRGTLYIDASSIRRLLYNNDLETFHIVGEIFESKNRRFPIDDMVVPNYLEGMEDFISTIENLTGLHTSYCSNTEVRNIL